MMFMMNIMFVSLAKSVFQRSRGRELKTFFARSSRAFRTFFPLRDRCVKESGKEIRAMPMLDWRQECAK